MCLQLLREHTVGRIAVVVHYAPVVLPVNYRLVETESLTLLAVRTRPDNVIERGGPQVAFEIDDIDPIHEQGWSVLVRGTLHGLDPQAPDFKDRFDPHRGSSLSATPGSSSSPPRSPAADSIPPPKHGPSTSVGTSERTFIASLFHSEPAARELATPAR